MSTNVITTDLLCLNPAHSTTRLVSMKAPIIVNLLDAKFESVLFLPDVEGRIVEGGLRTQGFFKQLLPGKPLVTVITVVFNGEKYLEETIQSVINQTYDNIEYIIIDGGSTDGTLSIINRYADLIDYWASEKDFGISDAFNKGITLSSGNIIGILNADDWYEKDAVKEAVDALIQCNSDIAHGLVQFWREHEKTELVAANHDLLMREMTINHPTVFVKRGVYESIGLFRIDMKYAMDYEWVLRAKCNRFVFVYIPVIIANMRLCGVSDRQWRLALLESYKSKQINCPSLQNKLYLLWHIFKGIVRRMCESIGLRPIVTCYHKYLSNVSKISEH